jgi:hypothetical protein
VLGTEAALAPPQSVHGTLRVSTANPRYFADSSGQIVLLTGSHTWESLQDSGEEDPPAPFNYERYLDDVIGYGHNFFRLWSWEQANGSADAPGEYVFTPLPFQRTGPGVAADGKPRFDLTRWDTTYFNRMRQRVDMAQRRGLYVAVMLFNGWSIDDKDRGLGNPWTWHPLNGGNNINGVDGDANGDGEGTESHTLVDSAVTQVQERYVRKVVETVNAFDNVLYEISNESPGSSTQWQYHMIRFIHDLEAGMPKQHPVGMTVEWPNGSNQVVLGSPAEWVSLNGTPGGLRDLPVAEGRKVIIDDTDHLCGICGDADWVWRSFTRGRNPVYMDVYDGGFRLPAREQIDPNSSEIRALRQNLGVVRAVASQTDLSLLVPQPDRCSSRFCLVSVDSGVPQAIVYLPEGGRGTVQLAASAGDVQIEWFSPRFDRWKRQHIAGAGRLVQVRSPFFWGPAVAVLRVARDSLR